MDISKILFYILFPLAFGVVAGLINWSVSIGTQAFLYSLPVIAIIAWRLELCGDYEKNAM